MKKVLVLTLPQTAEVTGGSINIFFKLSNLLANNNCKVIGACYGKNNKRPEELDDGIEYVNLFYHSDKKSYSVAINSYLDEIKPDLIIFFFPYLLIDAKLDNRFNNIRKILMFHSRPDYYAAQDLNYNEELKKNSKNITFQILFPSFFNLLPKWIKKKDIVCISNPVNSNCKKADGSFEKRKIIYLSRIDNKKGCEFLINSFSKIAKKYKDWQIDIWGQSEPYYYVKELEKLVLKKGLENQIYFKGVTKKASEIFLNYDFCVFPSLFEGFGLGLGEALSAGLPCAGLKGASGVNELIVDGYNGFLTEYDEKKYAKRIEELINNKDLRKKMGENAIKSIERFCEDNFNENWLSLVLNDKKISTIKEGVNDGRKGKCALFPLNIIFERDLEERLNKYPFIKKFFSVTNQWLWDRKYKIMYFLGKRFFIKRGKFKVL